VPASYGLQTVCMLLISGLNAMHQSFKALLWNLLRLFGLLLPAAWLGSLLGGTEGLFAGIALANVVCGLVAYLYALKLRRDKLAFVTS
ncbi:MATE family efflux transporter, partial [Vibrio natriegens]